MSQNNANVVVKVSLAQTSRFCASFSKLVSFRKYSKFSFAVLPFENGHSEPHQPASAAVRQVYELFPWDGPWISAGRMERQTLYAN